MNVFQTILERRELLANLTARELKIRYRGSVLGFLWSILIPLFMALIYVVFLHLLGGRGVPLADIIIGVFAWQFTVQCVNSGLGSITGNVNLVKKVYFPRLILPLAATLANLVNYLLSLLVQFPLVAVLLVLSGGSFHAGLAALPLVLLFQLLFNLGLALLMAALNVHFRDTQHLVGVLLTAWFFVSPVMYNLDMVAAHAAKYPWLQDLFMINPVAVIVTGYRACIMPGEAVPWGWPVAAAAGLSLLFLAGAYVLFQRMQKEFADLL